MYFSRRLRMAGSLILETRDVLQEQEDGMFSGKTLLITGGTGSFGNAVLREALVQACVKLGYSVAMKKSKTICGNNMVILKLNSILAMFVIINLY